ncbi:cell wall hydrolase [Priestia megaterium]|uniref:cell wall hydrolase n=1 Tax=Priestia megaterium TaxID=1404 RepID=UPI00203E88E2|nr:cell wall hydrolase [Priestia megaterium]MCM3155584.1 cell wall hydrolase [Priestia megaterium]
MKKLITPVALAASLLVASPAFAYEVKSGDTMGKIAKEHNMSLQELSKANPQVKDLNLIYTGQTINTNKTTQTTASTEGYKQITPATAAEKDLLARLVRAEAESEPYAGKVAVATVVLNRVDSDGFPNSISAVINQKANGYYQFSPVANGQINKAADAESIKAVNEALAFDRSKGAGSLFFYNPSTATSRWLDSKTTTLTIGNHVFKK